MANRSYANCLVACSLSLFLWQCVKKSQVSLDDLKAYALDTSHGLIKQFNNADYSFEIAYRPKDLLIEQFAGDANSFAWDSIATRLATYDYFILRLSKNRNEIEVSFARDPAAYNRILNYLNASIASDIHMVVDGRTVGVQEVTFVPSYGTGQASSVLLTFDSHLTSVKKSFKIIFDDTQFGTGRHKFDFDFGSIEAVPALQRK